MHDQLLKDLGTAFPADLATLMMPEVARQIDLTTLDFTAREYFLDTPLGRRRCPDLVSEAALLDDPDTRVVIHLELFSRYRSPSKGRVWDYNRLLAMRHQVPVHSGALYLRGGPEGHEDCTHEESSCGKVIWTFHFDGVGLSRSRARPYLARSEPLAWAFASVMKADGFASRAELALACLRRIVTAPDLDEARRFLLLHFVVTYVKLDEQVVREYEELLREPENVEVREMMTTWAEDMKAEGRLEGMRDVAVRLLTQRFGTPSERLRQRIARMSSSQELMRLIDDVVQVASPDELKLA